MMPLGRDSQSPERKEKSRSPFSSLGGRGRLKDQTPSSLAPPQEEPPKLREENAIPNQADNGEPVTAGINGTAGESPGRSAFTDGVVSSSENRLQEPLQPGNKAQEPEVSEFLYSFPMTSMLTL